MWTKIGKDIRRIIDDDQGLSVDLHLDNMGPVSCVLVQEAKLLILVAIIRSKVHETFRMKRGP